MPEAIVDRIKVVDADTHITEPEDLWTSRVSKKWGDLVPHVVPSPRGPRADGRTDDVWIFAADTVLRPTAANALAEYDGYLPDHPATLQDAIPGSYDAPARLKYMDTHGVYAHVIYPNVAGFGSGRYKLLKDPDLMFECVRAYNDFLVEWCSADPDRLIALMALPFWDIEEAVKEMHRAARLGHRGLIFSSQPEDFDEPALADPSWEPIWQNAEDLGLSVNFHIISGGGQGRRLYDGHPATGQRTNGATNSMLFFLDNAKAIADVIMSGICHRHPRLNFVSVESGIGWIPFMLEALDWQWINFGAQALEHPDRLLPSEYFRRQVYGCFWFERNTVASALQQYPDNFLFETDFPHPSGQCPGPASGAESPRDYIESKLGRLDEGLLRKVLRDNAARVYHLDG